MWGCEGSPERRPPPAAGLGPAAAGHMQPRRLATAKPADKVRPRGRAVWCSGPGPLAPGVFTSRRARDGARGPARLRERGVPSQGVLPCATRREGKK